MMHTISLNGKKNHGGLGGFISWARLEQFRASGELQTHEKLINIEINGNGIHYTVERR